MTAVHAASAPDTKPASKTTQNPISDLVQLSSLERDPVPRCRACRRQRRASFGSTRVASGRAQSKEQNEQAHPLSGGARELAERPGVAS